RPVGQGRRKPEKKASRAGAATGGGGQCGNFRTRKADADETQQPITSGLRSRSCPLQRSGQGIAVDEQVSLVGPACMVLQPAGTQVPPAPAQEAGSGVRSVRW